MSFDLYAPAEPPRRPPHIYRLLWERRKDGNWYADKWFDHVFYMLWCVDHALLREIGFSYAHNAIRWNPHAAPRSRVDEVMAMLNEKHAEGIADRQRIDAGHKAKKERADGALGRAEAIIEKYGTTFSRCPSIVKRLPLLRQLGNGSAKRAAALQVDLLCDAVEAAAAKKSAAKQAVEDKKAQLAAAIANRRAP